MADYQVYHVKVPIRVHEYNDGCCHCSCDWLQETEAFCSLFDEPLKTAPTIKRSMLRCVKCNALQMEPIEKK